MNTESVKINANLVNRVRKAVKISGQTISGFVGIAIEQHLYIVEFDQAAATKIKRTNKKN